MANSRPVHPSADGLLSQPRLLNGRIYVNARREGFAAAGLAALARCETDTHGINRDREKSIEADSSRGTELCNGERPGSSLSPSAPHQQRRQKTKS